jgi:translation elongation factor EF-G
MEDPEFEIGDVESYGQNNDSGFSHQGLVMTSIRRALENGSKEMKPGWFQNKIDRSGNNVRTYIEDTRKAFIESVESCLDVMECDIDDDAREEINKLIFDLAELKKKLNQDEDKEWDLLPRNLKIELTRQGKGNIKGYFNKDKIYYQLYLEESVKVYRQILRSLSRLTKRLDYYKAEIIEA